MPMNKNILSNHEYILSVQESWDDYEEVFVQFEKILIIHDYLYYLFKEKSTDRYFFLYPRYKGEHLESILEGKERIVNIAKKENGLPSEEPPTVYATGGIWVADANS